VTVFRSIAVWGPGIAALLLWSGIASPWLLFVVATVGLFGTAWWPLSVAVALTGWFAVDVPIPALVVAFLYRLVYADRIRALWIRLAERYRMRRVLGFASHAFGADLLGPQRSLRHRVVRAGATSNQHVPAPPVRCRHAGAGQYREGDRLMLTGRTEEALGSYLDALRAHPTEGLCSQALLARAAEAAADENAPRLALELATAALVGIPERPILRWATLAARATALQARAAAELGMPEEAARFLRTAQRIPHRNRPTERFVRVSAVMVFICSRQALNSEMAMAVISSETVSQQLNRPTPYELALLVSHWGGELQQRGDRQLAIEQYDAAIALVVAEGFGMAVTGPAGAGRVVAHHHRIASILLAAWCGRLECLEAPDEGDDFTTAADLAVEVGDHGLACRLFLADPRVRSHTGLQELIRRPLPSWAFADDRLQHSWDQIYATLAGLDIRLEPNDRAAAKSRAAEQFEILAQKLPSVFKQSVTRVGGTRDQDAPQREPDLVGYVEGERQPDEASRAADKLESGEAAPPLREEERHPTLADVVMPLWITAAEDLTDGPCLTLRRAWQLGRARGHHLLGPEHLFLAALSDSECRKAAEAAEITGPDIDRVLGKTMNSDGTPTGLTQSALSVLVDSASRAEQQGVTLTRPSHIVLSVLGASPSALLALCTGDNADEIAIRLTCRAEWHWTDTESRLDFGGAFSAPARSVLAAAVDAAGGAVVGAEELVGAVFESPNAPPTVRARASRLAARPRSKDEISTPVWAPNLRRELLTMAARCAQWSRGAD